MEYIFNDSVIFKDTEGLRYKQQIQAMLPMSVLQAGVLTELIKAQGKPVHRDDLLDLVWEKNGYPASNNSLNHNIGFLRKSLQNFGINDAIITVHRVGFKLSQELDVRICQSGTVFLAEGEDGINNLSDCFAANEIVKHLTQQLPLNKRWRRLRRMMQKMKLTFFVYTLMLPALFLIAVAVYLQSPAAETLHYVATVRGCKTYSVYHLDDNQKDKYLLYADGFLQSQDSGCGPDDMLFMYVKDESGFSNRPEGNERAFFMICRFDQVKSEFCNGSYAYSIEPQ